MHVHQWMKMPGSTGVYRCADDDCRVVGFNAAEVCRLGRYNFGKVVPSEIKPFKCQVGRYDGFFCTNEARSTGGLASLCKEHEALEESGRGEIKRRPGRKHHSGGPR